MDPDNVARTVEGGDLLGVGLVHGDVAAPPALFLDAVGGLTLDVVEDRPDDVFGIGAVVAGITVEPDRVDFAVGGGEGGYLCSW